MKIVVSGSTGLVGSALVPFLTAQRHSVTRLVRSQPKAGEVQWNPAAGTIAAQGLEGHDGVVHLAGETIMGRWTAAKKALIRDSRVQGTRLLSETLAKLDSPPRVLVRASAIGYYGSRGNEPLNEDSAPGAGYLAETCQEWEAASRPAEDKGIRVVHLRFGVVLSPEGGALRQMLPPFKLGVGGKVGSGRQWMSWVVRDDVLGAILHALTTESLRGPVNVVAPGAATNLEFTKTLGRVLRRPTIFPLPAFVVKLVFGEMGQELLLASTRVEPARLTASRYQFRQPQLEGALRHLLGK